MPRANFHHPFPARFAVGRSFAAPEERVRRDLVKAPAHGLPSSVLTELHDVAPLRAADHREVGLADRLGPQDVPGIESRIVDAHRRAITVAQRDCVPVAPAARRHDPHVLDRAALQRPAEMPFAGAAPRGAVVAIFYHVEIPRADELAVERHLLGAIRRRPGGTQGIEKRVHQAFSSATFIAAAPVADIWVTRGARSFGSKSMSQTTREPELSANTWTEAL